MSANQHTDTTITVTAAAATAAATTTVYYGLIGRKSPKKSTTLSSTPPPQRTPGEYPHKPYFCTNSDPWATFLPLTVCVYLHSWWAPKDTSVK